jgi:L-fuculokinase
MTPCIAVFDIGKTNKKCLLFDQNFAIIRELETRLEETVDDDGHPCDDLAKLTEWMRSTWRSLEEESSLDVVGLNFAAYGASLVHLNEKGDPVTPLYSYLKPFPEDLKEQFHATYGDQQTIAMQTASPPLGMLNSGLQLYWLKHRKPDLFRQIKTTLHFPQYCSYVFTGQLVTEYTGLGCHTALWDFGQHDYHAWVRAEGLTGLFPLISSHRRQYSLPFRNRLIPVGLGLHDSSSAVIPFLKQYADPFLLLSTGTWGITLNPFSQQKLTPEELAQDCLHSLTYEGKPVKASRLFIGNAHEEWARRLADHFHTAPAYFKSVQYQPELVPVAPHQVAARSVRNGERADQTKDASVPLGLALDLAGFQTYEQAYHHLIAQVAAAQAKAVLLAGEGKMERFDKIVVDGGFSRNGLFLKMLQAHFPSLDITVSQTSQGSAQGAALLLDAFVRKAEQV